MAVAQTGEAAVVTFASTHSALRAEDVLRAQGVSLAVIPPPANLSAGCGLALRVAAKDVPLIRETLARHGASYAAIHLLDSQQRATELLG
jgi:hypothetical protein